MNHLVKNNLFFARIALMKLILAFASVMTACSDDDEQISVYRPVNSYISMGMVNNGQIETDKGNILIPDSCSIERELSDGERVFLHCNVLDTEGKDIYRVRINKYFQLLTKDFVRDSESDKQELGENPINAEKAWFGGGFLNVRLGLLHNPSSGIVHAVNLVYDDVNSCADTVRFTLRHNAFGDTERTKAGTVHASFNLRDLTGDDRNKIYVILKWHWYNLHGVVVEHEERGYYAAEKEEETDENPGNDSVNIQ